MAIISETKPGVLGVTVTVVADRDTVRPPGFEEALRFTVPEKPQVLVMILVTFAFCAMVWLRVSWGGLTAMVKPGVQGGGVLMTLAVTVTECCSAPLKAKF